MVWSFCNEAIWFTAGFLVFRLCLRAGLVPRDLGGNWLLPAQPKKASPRQTSADLRIASLSKAGDHKAVLTTWATAKDKNEVLQVSALQAVCQALCRHRPEDLCEELVTYLTKQPHVARPAVFHPLVSTVLEYAQPELAQELIEAAEASKFSSAVTLRTRDLVLGAMAAKADVAAVSKLLARRDHDDAAWTSGSNAAARGFLRGGHVGMALEQLRGSELEAGTAASLLEAACTSKEISLVTAIDLLKGATIPAEAAGAAMAFCLRQENVVSAQALAARLREQNQLPYAVAEPYLKLLAKHNEEAALELLQEMQTNGIFLSEGLCGLVLSRSGEARHLQLAQAVQCYLRERSMTSLATYKTLMKVYATCENFEKACDLYDEIIADGVRPDTVMLGCLSKFAAKCNRQALSDKLFETMSSTGAQAKDDARNYIWLIRAAGQSKDVDKAVGLLRNLQENKPEAIDSAVYNSVLDVCVSSDKPNLVEQIIEEMQSKQLMTLVTYNTIIKGHCAKGEFQRARNVLADMRQAGLQPDAASFNCLLSEAVSAGSFEEAWSVFDELEKSKLEADNFTLSILMRMVRKSRCNNDARRALAVLDRSKLNICKDEILLNTVLDACIHMKDARRLARVLQSYEQASLKPSVQSYGLIIKAYALMKQVKKCWSTWQEMTKDRGLLPTEVTLSCMLDAAVSAGQVEDAVELFGNWRHLVPLNTVVFSNLIKGFAAKGDAERAMEMYREVKAEGLRMNLVAYSTLMDAQAKSGNTAQARELLRQMEADGIQPNTITYSSLIKGFCLKGDLDGALQAFGEMISKGLKADTIIYNTMLDGAVRHSRFSLCDQLLLEMNSNGVEASNFTLSIVVKMWGKRRQLGKAFEVVQNAINSGMHQLDSKLCTCIISACFHNGASKRAIQAMQEMKTWPNCDGPDSGTYENLVSNLCRAGLVSEAAQAAWEAMDLASGPRPSLKPLNEVVLKQLQKACEQKGCCDKWTSLQGKLREAKLRGA